MDVRLFSFKLDPLKAYFHPRTRFNRVSKDYGISEADRYDMDNLFMNYISLYKGSSVSPAQSFWPRGIMLLYKSTTYPDFRDYKDDFLELKVYRPIYSYFFAKHNVSNLVFEMVRTKYKENKYNQPQ